MSRTKGVLLLVLGIALAIFTKENWADSPLKFLGFSLITLPQALIIYASLAVGFTCGWLARGVKARRRGQTDKTTPGMGAGG
jgi:uncharacterized integral membrane protein